MQTKLQQIFKEYTDLKNYIQEDNKNLEKVKKEVHDQALQLDDIESQAGLYFDKLGYKNLLNVDFLEVQKKLYYTYEAYKDLVEVAEEIKTEIKNYKVKSVFAIIDGKKEIIDKDLYNSYRKQSQEYSVQLDKYNQIIQNGGAQ